MSAGFYIDGDGAQIRMIMARLEPWLIRLPMIAIPINVAFNDHRGANESLHQVAIGRFDIRFAQGDTGLACLLKISLMLKIQTINRTTVQQIQRQWFSYSAVWQWEGVFSLYEAYCLLRGYADVYRPIIGGGPE